MALWCRNVGLTHQTCPLSRWCPSLKTVVFHGSHESRDSMKKIDLAPGKYDVVLTTYEMVVSDASYFAHQYYRYIVLDEAQRIKNDNSLIGQACRRLRGAGRLLITGTPLQNDLHELWCLLNFLFPECFEDSQMFDAAFSKVASQRPDCIHPFPSAHEFICASLSHTTPHNLAMSSPR
jgi:SNF2 family DNA or RNA helicase